MATILDGKKVRDEIRQRLASVVSALDSKPVLAIVQIGENPESSAYIEQKKKFGAAIGAEVRHVQLPEAVEEDEVVAEIEKLNADAAVTGILVQIPIPKDLDKDRIIESVSPVKDVDGLTSASVKKLWANKKDGFVPATAKAVITLLDYYQVPLEGKRVVVIGRSELVGKPLFLSLINRNATVTLCHSKTENIKEQAKAADILIVAVGNPKFVTKDYVSPGQTVVDVGINVLTVGKLEDEIGDRKLFGDVDFDAVKDIVGAISPVPGGVGPLTVASLFENLLQAYQAQKSK